MKIFKHVFIVLIVYLLIAFVGVEIHGLIFTYNIQKETLSFSFVFFKYIQLFLEILPSLLIGGIIVGFAWAFGRFSKDNVTKFSLLRMTYVKGVFLVAVFCVALIFISNEWITPLLVKRQQRVLDSQRKFYEYVELAKDASENNRHDAAILYSIYAIKMNPNAEEVVILNDIIYFCKKQKEEAVKNKAIVKKTELLDLEQKNNVYTFMNAAKNAFEKQNFFDAHYYATLVMNATDENDTNKSVAKQIASDAWNKLNETNYEIDKLQTETYAQKRAGYVALLRGEVEKAYYLFKNLKERFPSDSDILRYYEVSRERLENQFFYIDETTDLQAFEQYGNVYFTQKNESGGKDVIFAKGVTVMEKAGSLYLYLRGLSVYSYDLQGAFQKSFSVPYAKVSAISFSNFGNELSWLSNVKKSDCIPVALLECVDRNAEGVKIVPTFAFANNELNKKKVSTFVFNMPYNDFLILCSAAKGAEHMTLASLISFSKDCSKYGYSTEVHLQTLMSRLMWPLLILCVILYIAILAWNYRIPEGVMFKFKWLFSLPIFSIVIFLCLELLSFLQRLLNYGLINIMGGIALPVTAFVYILLIIVLSITFMALPGN
ncbi:MAG: hypothetical protein GX220_04845 [Treponema sp.]|nr:hypothetical protein [Treponema sp.]